MSELNTRQWELYNFLKQQDHPRTQFDIACALDEHYHLIQEIEGKTNFVFHDTNARKLMTADIRAINKSDVIQKIIISTGDGIKLASEDEAKGFIRSRYGAIFRQLERARKLERKAGLDGQLKMVFGSEREIVQSFTDSNTEGEYWREKRRKSGLTQTQAIKLLRQYINIDAPLLSKIENGVCMPTNEQISAFKCIY